MTIQALGLEGQRALLPLEDDIASVAYWYQTEPHAKFPPLPPRDRLIIKPVEEIQRADEEEAIAKLMRLCLRHRSTGQTHHKRQLRQLRRSCDRRRVAPVGRQALSPDDIRRQRHEDQ